MATIGNGQSAKDVPTHRRRVAVLGATTLVLLVLPLLGVSGAEAAPSFTLSTTSPTSGGTVTGSIAWQVGYTGATPTRVSFYIDGVLRATDYAVPFAFELDTKTLSNASHVLKAVGAKAKSSAQTQVS